VSAILLSAHVIVAILAVGPIAVAASMFPRYAGEGNQAVASVLYRICQTYAVVGVAVPLLGIATAVSMGVLTQARVLVSIALTAVAAVVLVASILPGESLFPAQQRDWAQVDHSLCQPMSDRFAETGWAGSTSAKMSLIGRHTSHWVGEVRRNRYRALEPKE
jgi:hypothetical protein